MKAKRFLIIISSVLFLLCCKDLPKQEKVSSTGNKDIYSVTKKGEKKETYGAVKKELIEKFPFKTFLTSLPAVKHTGNTHADELSNRTANFIDRLFGLKEKDFSVITTSYTFRDSCIFYLHSIRHNDKDISIKEFIENIQGKSTEGYLGERVFIFAMKDDKEANYIDIPPNWNHIELKEELIDILQDKINSDVIICCRTQACEYEDLRRDK